MPIKKTTRILVVLQSYFTCYRSLQIGAADFAATRGDWRIDPPPDGPVRLLPWIEYTQPDGLILGPPALSALEETVEAVRRVPNSVALCSRLCLDDRFRHLPEVASDDEEVGLVAARHFLSKGFKHFAFVSAPASAWWAQQRFKGFAEELRKEGYEPAIWESHDSKLAGDIDYIISAPRDWLAALPKPLALFACNDARARECTHICETLSLRVPEDVAILGVDNDDLFCRLNRPPLSSVMIPWERMGFYAAELISQQLEGKLVAPGMHKLPPSGVMERQSTDIVAINDERVRAALQFIRTHASQLISVDDVAEAASLSRRDLEQRFRKLLDRSPLDEIRAAHLTRAKMLLATTNMTVDEVAFASGFASVHWFDKVFKQFLNCTPSTFRKTSRSHR
jgi:LacI family transcriptional regulator